MEVLFSIIVSVFNNEKYLPLAVRSITDQCFNNFELIIIDDGSTDETGRIADELAANDDHIRVVHQENRWIYGSFNRGISEAKGEYIYILNSDDKLADGSLELLERKVKEYNMPDLVLTRVVVCRCDEEQNVLEKNDTCDPKMILEMEERSYPDKDSFRRNWIYLRRTGFLNNQANLYKRKLALKHPFNEKYYGSDFLFNVSIAEEVETCLILKEPVYYFNKYNCFGMNASVGKYYPYEHEMSDLFYYEEKKMLERCGILDNDSNKWLKKMRIGRLGIEVAQMDFDNCPFTIEKKVKILMKKLPSGALKECFDDVDEEEFDCRILNKIRAFLRDKVLSEDSEEFFVYELLNRLMKFEKDSEDIKIIKSAVYNDLNPHRLGRALYEKLVG